MSQSGKRFLSGLFNRGSKATFESRAAKSVGRIQLDRRLGMEPLEERQLLSADPTLLSAFSSAQATQNASAVAPADAGVAPIDLSSVTTTVSDALYSSATITTTSSRYVVSDISAVLDRISCDQQGWAAALANILTYTGWSDNAVVVNPDVDSPIEQQTFDYISNAFTNDQTSLYYAFAWYMAPRPDARPATSPCRPASRSSSGNPRCASARKAGSRPSRGELHGSQRASLRRHDRIP